MSVKIIPSRPCINKGSTRTISLNYSDDLEPNELLVGLTATEYAKWDETTQAWVTGSSDLDIKNVVVSTNEYIEDETNEKVEPGKAGQMKVACENTDPQEDRYLIKMTATSSSSPEQVFVDYVAIKFAG